MWRGVTLHGNNPFFSHPGHLAILMGLTIRNAYLAIRDALDYSCITNQRYPLPQRRKFTRQQHQPLPSKSASPHHLGSKPI